MGSDALKPSRLTYREPAGPEELTLTYGPESHVLERPMGGALDLTAFRNTPMADTKEPRAHLRTYPLPGSSKGLPPFELRRNNLRSVLHLLVVIGFAGYGCVKVPTIFVTPGLPFRFSQTIRIIHASLEGDLVFRVVK